MNTLYHKIYSLSREKIKYFLTNPKTVINLSQCDIFITGGMMIYVCKYCGAEYDLREIDLEAECFCEVCGSQELVFLSSAKAA